MKNIKIDGVFWIQAFAFVAACVLLFALFLNFQEVLAVITRFFQIISPFIAGTAIAYLLSGPCNTFERLLSCPSIRSSRFKFIAKSARGISVFIVYILTILIIALIISFFLPLILQNVLEFIQNLPQIFMMIENWLRNLEWNDLNNIISVEYYINEFLNSFTIGDMLPHMVDGMSSIHGFALTTATGIIDAAVALVISIYALLYKDRIFRFMNWVAGIWIKEKKIHTINKYVAQANDLFYRFLRAQFLDACIMAVLSMILLGVLGVSFAITLGFFLGICNMIPKFGSIFGTIIVVILSFITGGGTQAILVAVLLTTLQQIDGNIIGPKIMGKALKINPILVFFALVIGGAYFGIIGMFVSIPVMAMVKIIFMNIMGTQVEKKKNQINIDKELNEVKS